MSNETQPQPSPAALLAGVLRVVAPKWEWESFSLDRFAHGFTDSEKDYQQLDPTSKDDLARVVAMLDGAQRVRFDAILDCYWVDEPGMPEGGHWHQVMPSELLTTPTSTILAALVAATGVKA